MNGINLSRGDSVLKGNQKSQYKLMTYLILFPRLQPDTHYITHVKRGEGSRGSKIRAKHFVIYARCYERNDAAESAVAGNANASRCKSMPGKLYRVCGHAADCVRVAG